MAAEFGGRGVAARMVCAVLGAPRCRLYPRPRREHLPRGHGRIRDDAAGVAVRRVCERYPTYGYRRVAAMLRREGLRVNHKRVRRLMRELGLSQLRIRTQRVGSSQRKVAGGAV